MELDEFHRLAKERGLISSDGSFVLPDKEVISKIIPAGFECDLSSPYSWFFLGPKALERHILQAHLKEGGYIGSDILISGNDLPEDVHERSFYRPRLGFQNQWTRIALNRYDFEVAYVRGLDFSGLRENIFEGLAICSFKTPLEGVFYLHQISRLSLSPLSKEDDVMHALNQIGVSSEKYQRILAGCKEDRSFFSKYLRQMNYEENRVLTN